MQAIILAGGFGTRLRSVVTDVPKPMAPVCGRPFLNYILDNLNAYHFTKVVLAVGFQKEVIMNYYKNRYKDIEIVYSVEEGPLGTGGCLKQAMQYIDDDFAFVLNGDTLFNVDYIKMAKLNRISIACKEMIDFDRYGEVLFDENQRIQSFEEKKFVHKGFINGGIYYLPKNVLDGYALGNRFSLEKDFFEVYMKVLSIQAFLSNAYFLDIGIPEDYDQAQIDFGKKKALFLDRDGVVNIDYGHVHTIEQFHLTDFIIKTCKKYQDQGYLIFVVTNQAGIGKGLYKEMDFIKLNVYMKKLLKEKGVEIEDIFYCPHKPEDRCDCRKPKPGLFLEAIETYKLDVCNSVVIGDKLSDLEAGYRAGIKELYLVPSKYDLYDVDFDYKIFIE
ncbi:MAG: D-glycero-beta-D-manno-heptose 1,7-bisphosphate 7-phosphatase [Roseburia sp.]|nr:D-glycero-beta-D-manno-heptose 1,7-bisphosphate 7-phosphatase [Anaeroplasma bactoclasticum]MCM1196264.1 D-glycero-beta-D-manno-heptose 1,7-bisphosphate 7-phosphatase [Roseburia sp.]MCM1557371.1 D-glycero-beta-D-manno-heptose 1,7-bisphosphate 7-phosphatase [Anaeroplasma bactoclasticum]